MSKVIRIITYEGDSNRLKTQMDNSLYDGHCEFISPLDITVQTIYTDVESHKLHFKPEDVPDERKDYKP